MDPDGGMTAPRHNGHSATRWRLLVFPLPHIATVNANRQRRLGTRQCCPLPGAAFNETYPFIAQGCFCSLGNPVQIVAYFQLSVTCP